LSKKNKPTCNNNNNDNNRKGLNYWANNLYLVLFFKVNLRIELSRVATTAFLSTSQRGFIWLNFSDTSDAQDFMQK